MKDVCPNCENKSLEWGSTCPICGYKDWNYDDLPKDKYNNPIRTKHGRSYSICSHCGEKVENWFRWSDDSSPPDDWGELTDIRWLCKKCYKKYKQLLEKFVPDSNILKCIKEEGYLMRNE